MTLALRYAVRSDVGLLREGNEDSAYAGPRLLAVADGMGGHAAGEVASAVAISALAHLDDDVPGTDLVDALGEAVRRANTTLHEMVIANPALDGMGTTLTAMLWSGPHIALCHIGDSRAYLLRDNELYQITHDHTLVQKLQDEGRISPDEAATHPQRSLILRALDGRGEAEPDLSLREAKAGDRYLLCSDGLSGVVSAETLHRTLTTVPEPDRAVIQLVDLANRGGGPDNITCIVADVVDSATAKRAPTDMPVMAGAASNGRGLPQAPLPRPDTPAGRAKALTHTAPQPVITDLESSPAANGHDGAGNVTGEDDGGGVRPRRRWPIVTSVLVVLFAVIAGGAFAAWRYSQSQYYVAADGGRVAIFRGINEKVAGLSLWSVYQRTAISLTAVPLDDRTRIAATIQATNLADAQRIVSHISQEVQKCQAAQAQLAQWQKDFATYQKELKTWNKTHKGKKPLKPLKPSVPSWCPPSSATGTQAGATPAPSAGAT
ncbi:MAG: protein phosphatase 2C domain-containing protein [Micromonosporaceae bacterium]